MKTAVITFPASNCDRDMAVALEYVTGKAPLRIWHQETHIPDDVGFIALPGGFSYGDYLRCGAMAAHSVIMQEVKRHAARGTRILGVCNGFQILCEAGLLSGVLLRNAGQKFICRSVSVKVNTHSKFTNTYHAPAITLPIAHHDGNYFADEQTLTHIKDNDLIAFQYCDAAGNVTQEANPNGAVQNIAGIFNDSKTILGMMPHPERVVDGQLQGGTDGAPLFKSIVEALN
jgi:phosphoribosylformylglycinamidine synthase I